MKITELIKWSEETHQHYCRIAQEFITGYRGPGFYFKVPSVKWVAKKSCVAGKAILRKHICEYNLAYTVAVEKDFRQTIAHEVAHHLVWQIDPLAKYHGDLFKFILEKIFIRDRLTHHSYSYVKMNGNFEKAKLYVKLIEQIKILKEDAELLNQEIETERS
jgi:predicted SprT family Zn-dependent metalloprotease